VYNTDKDAFVNNPRFTTEFVGLGPYQLVRWEPGSHLEMARFDSYFKGRPPLDRVIVRFIRDANALLANALAESVDVVTPPSVELEQAAELRRRWEGTGNLVRVEPIPRIQYMELQLGPDLARPRNGFPVLAVRQALYHALDRAELADVMTLGGAPAADSWYRPDEPIRRDMEAGIPKYPYDRARAQQMLAQTGWTPGPDGTLTHTSGERFEVEIWMNPQASEKALAIVADQWKRIGLDTKPSIIPAARSEDREYTAQHPGPLLTGTFLDALLPRYDSRDMASAANRWGGRNRAGYVNQKADQLLDQLATTIDPRQRVPLLRDQVQTIMEDVAFMPLYWEPRPLIALRTVRADIHPYNVGWNAETWDKQ
jgi:peptide/nickel transport system substrate-binding protein